MLDKCPRCGVVEFNEHDSGPDSYDDDITYTSYSCKGCDLWYDSWIDKWFDGVDNWRSAQDAEEWLFVTKYELIESIEHIIDSLDDPWDTENLLYDMIDVIKKSYISEYDVKKI